MAEDELMPSILANFKTTQAYIKARYGSLSAAYDKPGGYAQGGYIEPDEDAGADDA